MEPQEEDSMLKEQQVVWVTPSMSWGVGASWKKKPEAVREKPTCVILFRPYSIYTKLLSLSTFY